MRESSRAAEARKLFEQGKIDDADAVLNEESLEYESQYLLEQEHRIEQEQVAHNQRRFNLAMEYVLKAKFKLLQIKDVERFSKADALFEEATQVSRAPQVLYEYAKYLTVLRESCREVDLAGKAIELLNEAIENISDTSEDEKNAILELLDLCHARQVEFKGN